MVTYETEMRIEILKQIQRKSSAMNEIYRLTEELGETLSRSDRISQQMILAMRKEEMDKVDECEKHIHQLLLCTPEPLQENLRKLVRGEWEEQTDQEEENMIVSIVRATKSVLEKTVNLDRRLSSRLAGVDSFYENKQ